MATTGAPTVKGLEPSIRKVYQPEGEELDVLRHVYDRFYKMSDKRKEYEPEWEKWEKQVNAWRPPRGDDWKSNIYIPLTTSIIEAQLSEIIEQTLRPWVVERGSEDSARAKVINAILDYTWEIAKSDVALFEMIKNALIYGTAIGMEYYWRQPRTIKTTSGKEQKVLEYDNCYLDPVRIWDFYVDEKAMDFSGPFQAQDCIRRYVMDYDDFRTFFSGPVWNPLNNAEIVKPGGKTNYYEFFKPPERINHDREVEVLWYWNKPSDLLSVVANDVNVLFKPNPYRHKQLPFVKAIDIKRPFQFYGKGEPELLESIQEETNTLRRMIIDRNHLDIDKPILVSDTLTIEDEDTVARPHGVIPVGNVNDVKFPEYSDIAGSVFKSLEMLNDDKVRVTGMDERQQGVSAAGTATEAAILKEATLKRLNMKIWQMKNDTLIDIGRLRVENIMQFYAQPRLEEIVGDAEVAKAKQDDSFVQVEDKKYKASYRQIRLKDQAFSFDNQTRQPNLTPTKGFTFFEAKPEFFLPSHGGYDVKYKATSTVPISKPLQQQKADELYDRLIQNPTVDPWKLAEYLLKSREEDPDMFKKEAAPPGDGANADPPVDLRKIIDLAGIENQEMLQGKPIGPTPYAPVVHTEVHIEFMKSDKFKKEANDKIVQLFTNHVTGEVAAQQARGGQPGADQGAGAPGADQGGQAAQESSGAAVNAPMSNVAPSRMMGGADTQNVSGAQSQ